MSALDRPKIEDAEAVIKAAEEMLSALCHGKRFEMTIPVQETDPDIVIGNALYIASELLRERAKLTTPVTWKQEEFGYECYVWECSGCKEATIWEDSPEENNVHFCSNCGHPIAAFEPFKEESEE